MVMMFLTSCCSGMVSSNARNPLQRGGKNETTLRAKINLPCGLLATANPIAAENGTRHYLLSGCLLVYSFHQSVFFKIIHIYGNIRSHISITLQIYLD